MWKRGLTGLALFLVLLSSSATAVFADPTDSGSITVTGSVPPKSTSISTDIGHNASSPVAQGTEITYTITYRSSNTAEIPLSFRAEWTKGTVEGADLANVDVVDYVLGSADQAYGDTQPVIDLENNRISWSIDSLPANLGDQTVSFRLRTTSAYTGEKKVSFPVQVVVLSPIGVTDKSTSVEYQYVATASATSPTPSPSPTPILEATPVSVGTLSTLPTIYVPVVLEGVDIRSIGAVSARIGVTTSNAVPLVIRYGLSPNSLTNSEFLSETNTSRRDFILTNLIPDTSYYFQFSSPYDASFASEVFTFKTSSQISQIVENRQLGLTVAQQRAVLFSGQVSSDVLSEQAQPITIQKNTILDLSLRIPSSEVVKKAEVAIRSQGVLGVSTELLAIDSDELQSLSTLMTKVGPDLFVGKVRAPVTVGTYELVHFIEDVYGNIIEKPLLTLNVVSPLEIQDALTGEPLEHARVDFYIYNQQLHLFEHLSNVTTLVQSPTFSNSKGVVEVLLFTGFYRAEVYLPGYEKQAVEFTIGSNGNGNLPQVSLERNSNRVFGPIEYVGGLFMHAYQIQVNLFDDLSQSRRMYQLFVTVTAGLSLLGLICMLVLSKWPLLNSEYWLFVPNSRRNQQFVTWFVYFVLQLVRFLGEVLVSVSLIFGVLFVHHFGWREGGLVLLLACCALTFWIIGVFFLKKQAIANQCLY